VRGRAVILGRLAEVTNVQDGWDELTAVECSRAGRSDGATDRHPDPASVALGIGAV